ncbi:MAG: ribonuclease H family protein [Lachnospiraceae bacterium]|nr:ribonuclease H family protein [Lachnospiraceae bacterium]
MAKRKIYAVKKGKATGIFETWDACKAAVDGYPGAEYKGFHTKEEAVQYLSGHRIQEVSSDRTGKECLPGQIVAYVDGSYDEKIGRYAFGCILITPNGDMIRESGSGDNPESLALRNVTGEMLGAMFAVQWCVKNAYQAVNICYDYSGIEMWVTGAWKAKNDLTQKYADYMQRNAERIRITFTKIAAHTGNYYNEEVDKLAKAALKEGKGIPKIKREEK